MKAIPNKIEPTCSRKIISKCQQRVRVCMLVCVFVCVWGGGDARMFQLTLPNTVFSRTSHRTQLHFEFRIVSSLDLSFALDRAAVLLNNETSLENCSFR